MNEPIQIRIGVTTTQDLTLDLGSPLRVHYREDDRMTIHQSNVQEDPDISNGCELGQLTQSTVLIL